MRLDASLTQLDPAGRFLLHLPSPLNGRLRYGAWETGLSVQRWMDGHWIPESLDPGIPLLHAANDEPEAATPVRRFIAGIPAKIRRLASPYRHLQTSLLQWTASDDAAAELLGHAPNLLWLLISTATEQEWTVQERNQLLTRRRIAILEALTGIRSEAAVKFLNRITLLEGDVNELSAIKQILDQPAVWRSLSAWASIPVHSLAVLLRNPELCGSRLLRQIAAGEYRNLSDAVKHVEPVAALWRDACYMAPMLGIADAPQALAQCATVEAMARLHDRWMDRLNRRAHVITDGRDFFPPPPIPGNDAIHPILSAEDLRAEGRLMKQCVAGYARLVSSRRCYLYRMLSPQRATIEVRMQGSVPVITQFKLARNEEPNAASKVAAYEWVNRAK
ncbi:PcfJ domain-containing protein [Thiocystis minor]|uniref:PcfJ domain-containing protein n=1 Tax=Thiocystis minor TaxID=61597 RepID=UPI0019131DF5|nr:PcfJ domain-containing protein [Thiocystis minor]